MARARARVFTSLLALPFASLLLSACHGPGLYGHAPNYESLDAESVAIANARDFDAVAYGQNPADWRKGNVMAFGVVEERDPGPGGAAMLKLSVRRLEPLNFCDKPGEDDTCRVTVSDKDYGVVYALVPLHGDDDTGPLAVGQKSLLRVVGSIGEDVNNAPVIHVTYYRHWPVDYYVTHTSDAR